MPKLKINGTEVEVENGTSILQAAEQVGYEIPRFCYHDRLSVPANCRMCLVEVKGAPKPVASCAMAAGDGMEVETESDVVKKARRGVMEMLLINHPLDCPICDQGGECDLQDQAMGYGFDRSRYRESKRAVPNKDLGPLIKTIMTRCIQCTRCVRFGEEVAGTPELGLLNRGEDVEIGTFIEKAVTTELSGNMIDICPVGALTNKPYAYKARPWELTKTETIDVHNGLGSNIRVDSRGGEVMRVLPRLHEDVNEEWIDDRTRFSYDGLKKRRLDRPYMRNAKGKLEECSWEDALSLCATRLQKVPASKIGMRAGGLCVVEDLVAFKDLADALDVKHISAVPHGMMLSTASRGHYIMNSGIAGVENADAILIIGFNPRHDAALLNARIRKTWLEKRIPIAMIGQEIDLGYPCEYLGNNLKEIDKIGSARSGFAKEFKSAEKPLILLGSEALQHKDGEDIHKATVALAEKIGVINKDNDWNGFNVVHAHAATTAALDMGLVSDFDLKKSEVVYLLNADSKVVETISKDAFVIYQGHHGDRGAHRADVILPGSAFTEKDFLLVNTEGRVQLGKRAVFAPGQAKEDWRILRALSEKLNKTFSYSSHYELRERIYKEFSEYQNVDVLPEGEWVSASSNGKIGGVDIKVDTDGFYLANSICRASNTMHQCYEEFILKPLNEKAA